MEPKVSPALAVEDGGRHIISSVMDAAAERGELEGCKEMASPSPVGSSPLSPVSISSAAVVDAVPGRRASSLRVLTGETLPSSTSMCSAEVSADCNVSVANVAAAASVAVSAAASAAAAAAATASESDAMDAAVGRASAFSTKNSVVRADGSSREEEQERVEEEEEEEVEVDCRRSGDGGGWEGVRCGVEGYRGGGGWR